MNNINENSLKHFNELRDDINNIDEKFDKRLSVSQKHFNELKDEMKEVKQNTSLVKQFDKCLNEVSDSQKQIINRCDNIIENMKDRGEKWKRDTVFPRQPRGLGSYKTSRLVNPRVGEVNFILEK